MLKAISKSIVVNILILSNYTEAMMIASVIDTGEVIIIHCYYPDNNNRPRQHDRIVALDGIFCDQCLYHY